jgi:predicted ATPase with chaperone activity
MMRLQAVPSHPASIESVRSAFSDLILPESLLQTLGCVINSRRSLFLTGLPGTGKTAVSERMNSALKGTIWIPYAIDVDGQIIRIFDNHSHVPVPERESAVEFDRRWIEIERPLIIVGGELTLENTDLTWSETAKFYEAPFQVKSNGGTLVIDDFGRQRVTPQDLLNRWILPLERRVDFLTLHNGKKIEVPFEQLVVFSTNLDERDLVDDAFLRRMGYRARVEPPTPAAYSEIFKRALAMRSMAFDQASLTHVLNKYDAENRMMKGCEPRDLLNRVTDICLFEGQTPHLSPELIDIAWRNYFGSSHGFSVESEKAAFA